MGTENNEQKGTKQKMHVLLCQCVCEVVQWCREALTVDTSENVTKILQSSAPRTAFFTNRTASGLQRPSGTFSSASRHLVIFIRRAETSRVTGACELHVQTQSRSFKKKSTDRQLNWPVVGWWWSLEVKQEGTPWGLWRLQSLEHPSRWRGSPLLCWHTWPWSNTRETFSHGCAET